MKILHTADWHLGQSFYNYDRLADHKVMLEALGDVIAREHPDALVVSGDVFDVAQPSTAAQALLSDALSRFHAIVPEMVIVVTAGNHDSPSRHEIFRSPWQLSNVTVIGLVPPADCFDDICSKLIIDLPGRGVVVAVPFMSRRAAYGEDFVARLAQRALEVADGRPMVLCAHLPVTGADFTGHDVSDPVYIGNVESVDVSEMPGSFDYVALGHIHTQQCIDAPGASSLSADQLSSMTADKVASPSCAGKQTCGRVWYSGTPLPVSFDTPDAAAVLCVTVDAHGALPDVRSIPLAVGTPMVTLPQKAVSWDEALAALKNFPDDKRCYLRLNVAQTDMLPPDAVATARRVAADKALNFCLVNFSRICDSDNNGDVASLSIPEFLESDPIDIARRFYDAQNVPFTDRTRSLLSSLLDDNMP